MRRLRFGAAARGVHTPAKHVVVVVGQSATSMVRRLGVAAASLAAIVGFVGVGFMASAGSVTTIPVTFYVCPNIGTTQRVPVRHRSQLRRSTTLAMNPATGYGPYDGLTTRWWGSSTTAERRSRACRRLDLRHLRVRRRRDLLVDLPNTGHAMGRPGASLDRLRTTRPVTRARTPRSAPVPRPRREPETTRSPLQAAPQPQRRPLQRWLPGQRFEHVLQLREQSHRGQLLGVKGDHDECHLWHDDEHDQHDDDHHDEHHDAPPPRRPPRRPRSAPCLTANGTVTAGDSFSDKANVTGGNSPTGTVAFNVYAGSDGTRAPTRRPPVTSAQHYERIGDVH